MREPPALDTAVPIERQRLGIWDVVLDGDEDAQARIDLEASRRAFLWFANADHIEGGWRLYGVYWPESDGPPKVFSGTLYPP